MINTFLSVHIIGAIATGAVVIYALYTLINTTIPRTKAFNILSVLSVFQITTGILLSIASGETTLAFCSKAALYLAVIIATQLALLFRNNISVHSLVPVHGINIAMIGLFVVFFG